MQSILRQDNAIFSVKKNSSDREYYSFVSFLTFFHYYTRQKTTYRVITMTIQTCGVIDSQCQVQGSISNKQENLTRSQPLRQMVAGKLQHMAAVLKRWKQNHQTRQQLRHMDAHLLKDIGISHADMIEEASKRFWQS